MGNKGEYPENSEREYIWGTMKQACVTGCLRMQLHDRGYDLKDEKFSEKNIAKVLDTNEKTGARMDKAEKLLKQLGIDYHTFTDISMRDIKVALDHKDCDGSAFIILGNYDDDVSHMVLVDRIDNNGDVYIRDPREGAYSANESEFRRYFLKQAMLPSGVKEMVQERIQERINRKLFGDEKDSQRSSSDTFQEEIKKSMSLLKEYNQKGKTGEALKMEEYINDITSELKDHEANIRKSLEKRFSKLSLESNKEKDTEEEVSNKDNDALQDKPKTLIQELFENYIAASQNKDANGTLKSTIGEKEFTDKLQTDIEKNMLSEHIKKYQKIFKEYKEAESVLRDPEKHLAEEIDKTIKEALRLEKEIKETEEYMDEHSLKDQNDPVAKAYQAIQATHQQLLRNNKEMLARLQRDMNDYSKSSPELDQTRLKILEEQFEDRLKELTNKLKDEHSNMAILSSMSDLNLESL